MMPEVALPEDSLLGLSDINSDMLWVLQESENQQAVATVEHFAYAMMKYVGAYRTLLGGLEALVRTAGIGDHSVLVPAALRGKRAWLGVKLNEQTNAANGSQISVSDSTVSVWGIPTNEELTVAHNNWCLLTDDGAIAGHG